MAGYCMLRIIYLCEFRLSAFNLVGAFRNRISVSRDGIIGTIFLIQLALIIIFLVTFLSVKEVRLTIVFLV